MAPRTGNYRHVATLQVSVPVKDPHLGRTETWPNFGTWRVSVTDLPFVKTEHDSTVLHLVEGLWRQDIWDRFFGGKTVRILVNGMTLKALALVNVGEVSRVLQVHAAKIVST